MFNLSVVLFTIPIVKDIGISDIDIALIYTVLPFTVFIAPPLVGFLADRLGIYSACAIKVDALRAKELLTGLITCSMISLKLDFFSGNYTRVLLANIVVCGIFHSSLLLVSDCPVLQKCFQKIIYSVSEKVLLSGS